MKKVLYVLIGIALLTGCSCTANMENTPTKKVEAFLNKYQTNDDDVVSDLDQVLTNDTTLTSEERESYRDFMKNHYQNLKYEIKNEKIDGSKATVETEITVKSYTNAINEANKYRLEHADEFDNTNTFATYRLNKLKEVTNTETYTINFHLTKENEEWKLDALNDEDQSKINGLYGVTDINTTTPNTNDTNDNDNGVIGDMVEDGAENMKDNNTTNDDNSANNNSTNNN